MKSLSASTAETQRAQRKRRDKKREVSGSSLRSLGVLCASVVNLLFLSIIANAQTGVITGRVVSEDGTGLPNAKLYLFTVGADRRQGQGGSQNQTAADEDGNFKFTGLAPRVYSLSASPWKGYVQRPAPSGERQNGGYYRVGDNVTITMIKGGVISGKVTNAMGEPLIGVQVNAMMTRNFEGNPVLSGPRH